MLRSRPQPLQHLALRSETGTRPARTLRHVACGHAQSAHTHTQARHSLCFAPSSGDRAKHRTRNTVDPPTTQLPTSMSANVCQCLFLSGYIRLLHPRVHSVYRKDYIVIVSSLVSVSVSARPLQALTPPEAMSLPLAGTPGREHSVGWCSVLVYLRLEQTTPQATSATNSPPSPQQAARPEPSIAAPSLLLCLPLLYLCPITSPTQLHPNFTQTPPLRHPANNPHSTSAACRRRCTCL